MKHEKLLVLALRYAKDLLEDVEPMAVSEHLDLDYEDAVEVADTIRQLVEPQWVGY